VGFAGDTAGASVAPAKPTRLQPIGARQGMAWQGEAWLGRVRRGVAGAACSIQPIEQSVGWMKYAVLQPIAARPGWDGQGEAGPGLARQGL